MAQSDPGPPLRTRRLRLRPAAARRTRRRSRFTVRRAALTMAQGGAAYPRSACSPMAPPPVAQPCLRARPWPGLGPALEREGARSAYATSMRRRCQTSSDKRDLLLNPGPKRPESGIELLLCVNINLEKRRIGTHGFLLLHCPRFP